MPYAELEEVISLLQHIEEEAESRINLIPSENLMSLESFKVMSSIVSQQYVFNKEALLQWPAMAMLVKLQTKVEQMVRKQFAVNFCSIRPLSGINCMTIMLSFFKSMGLKRVYVVPLRYGGHGNTIKLAKRFGLIVDYLPFNADKLDFDINSLHANDALKNRDFAIYIDQWVTLKPPSISILRECVGDGVHIHYDISHLLGLIAGGAIRSPMEFGATTLGGSTHKTFPGPQKGILMWNDSNLTDPLDSEIATFISHPHTGSIAALGVTLAQFQSYGARYSEQVLQNARVCGETLASFGINVIGEEFGFTMTHQIVVDLPANTNLQKLGQLLYESGISLNFLEEGILDCKCPFRIGVQEITFRGMKEQGIRELAILIARIVQEQIIGTEARAVVRNLISRYLQKKIQKSL